MTTRLTPHALEGKNRKLLRGCREERLVEFKPEDAVKYFQKEGISATRAEIIEVSTRYGFHPLSLSLLVGLINEDHNKKGDIIVAKQLEIFDDIKANKHHVLERAYDSLMTERKELLSKISCFRGSIEYDTIKKLFNNPDLEKSLIDLRKRGLLKYTDKTRRYDMHPIVRHYAYDRFTDSERKQTHMDLAFHFIDVMPVTNKNVKTLEDLAPVIELYHHMVRSGNTKGALHLLIERFGKSIHYQFGNYELEIELLSSLFNDNEFKQSKLEDEPNVGFSLNQLANAYSLSGQPHRAVPIFQSSVALAEKMGNKENIAIGLGNLAHLAQIDIGMLSAAEGNLRRCIDLCHEIANDFNEAIGHQELGRVVSYCGYWREAGQELEKAQTVFDEHGVQRTNFVSVIRAIRAQLYIFMKRFDDALEFANESLALAIDPNRSEYGGSRDIIRAHWLLGSAYRANNELTLAEENLFKALDICRQINMVDHEANILLDVAWLRYAQGDFKDAKDKAEEALVITERSGYVLQGADVNLFLAQYALEQEKDKVKAKEFAEKAKELAYCDGGEYKYKVAYEEAERFLKQLAG